MAEVDGGSSFPVPSRYKFGCSSVLVQQPAASSSDVLTCVDLSVYLMMERDTTLQ